jgi:hypothetical protein
VLKISVPVALIFGAADEEAQGLLDDALAHRLPVAGAGTGAGFQPELVPHSPVPLLPTILVVRGD